MVSTRQFLGIIGIIMAVLGGIAWFFQQKLTAFMLWGGAALIMFKLNKRTKKK
ncbi:MAG TPA: hypothetical protein VF222_00395 [Nitrososphaeraceae archaeon]